MITGLDHVVLLVRDIDAGVAGYQALLGCAAPWRAERDGAATAIFTLSNMSLELMAPKGEGSVADRIRAAIEANGEGVASLAFAVADIETAHHRLTRLGLEPEAISGGESRDLESGQIAAWKRTRAANAATHGMRLFFLQRTQPWPSSRRNAATAIDALDHLVISTPDPDRTAALYGARLGLDMRLDRTIAALDTRFLFFRCGGVVLEIIHRLNEGRGDGPDTVWGLSWRTADIVGTRTRLSEAGFEVSELRQGRKPGTRVFTVQTGTFGVPTLVIEQGGRSD